MERIQPMNELQIQEKVEDLAGKSARILDCEQNTLNQMEEVLLVNGVPISLAGEEGAKIKQALIHGEVPPCDLVNNMLIRAGIEKNPVELETTVNVKSSTKTVEHSQLVDSNGVLVDEKMREKEDEDEFKTVNVEIWNTELSNNSMEHRSAGGKGKQGSAITHGKAGSPEVGKSHKKSIFSPSKFMKLTKNFQSGDTSGGGGNGGSGNGTSTYKTASQLVPLTDAPKKDSASSNSQKTLSESEMKSSAKKENSAEVSQKSHKNNKILSFFLKGKSKEAGKKLSSKPTHRPYETEVRTAEEGTKSKQFSIINPLGGGDKSKKKSKTPASFAEPKYDNIVHSSAAVMSAQPKFKNQSSYKHQDTNILDPTLSLINVEIDGIPARVTYETFV